MDMVTLVLQACTKFPYIDGKLQACERMKIRSTDTRFDPGFSAMCLGSIPQPPYSGIE